MSKLLVTTIAAGALALAAFYSPVTAAASSRDNGVSNSDVQTAATEEISAQRRYRRRPVRRYRAVRVYPAPYYYGYYGPTYYYRPYSRPAPLPLIGFRGWW